VAIKDDSAVSEEITAAREVSPPKTNNTTSINLICPVKYQISATNSTINSTTNSITHSEVRMKKIALMLVAALGLVSVACSTPPQLADDASISPIANVDAVTGPDVQEAEVVSETSNGVAAQILDRFEYSNVVSNTGVAGAEAFLQQYKKASVAQTINFKRSTTLSASRTVTVTGEVSIEAATNFVVKTLPVALKANGKVTRTSSTTYSVAITTEASTNFTVPAGKGANIYGYLTGRYYSYSARKCSNVPGLGCSAWARQTVFVPEGIGTRIQVF
jgi:hypothetical protein